MRPKPANGLEEVQVSRLPCGGYPRAIQCPCGETTSPGTPLPDRCRARTRPWDGILNAPLKLDRRHRKLYKTVGSGVVGLLRKGLGPAVEKGCRSDDRSQERAGDGRDGSARRQ